MIVGAWGAGAGVAGEAVTERLRLDGMTAAARVFQTGEPFRVEDYAELDDGDSRSLAERSVRSGVAVPIRMGGEIWGALSALSTRRGSLPGHTEDALGEFAETLSLAIANSEARSQLERRATCDPLTGLANHREFHERLAGEVARAEREGQPVSLILMDLDHFKQVNDIHGHQAGDLVLKETAARLSATVRSGELVGRVGGEEFAWIVPGATGREAHAAAERAREAIRATPFPTVGGLTISCGVCDLATAKNAQELFRLADSALYSAKSHGRDLTVAYSPGANQDLSTRQRAERLERSNALHALRALARAIDAKDAYTQQHSERVADLAVRLATASGWSVLEAARLREAGLVHDVGKIGVSDSILLKPGRLTSAEFRQVKEHAALSAKIVQEVLMEDQVSWVAHHHERWDGGGYPDGLSGDEIPEGARLLALADTWDAITVERGYGMPMSLEEALAECRSNAGLQFWPEAVRALESLVEVGAVTVSAARPTRRTDGAGPERRRRGQKVDDGSQVVR